MRRTFHFAGHLMVLGVLFLSGTAGAEEVTHYDRVNLAVSTQQEVEADTLVVVLFAQAQGEDLPRLTESVNNSIKQAVDRSKRVPGIEVQTLSYQTYPVYQNQRLTGWRVRQSMQLESRHIEDLSELLGNLQQLLAIESMRYTISPAQRKQAEEGLITRAIEQFTRRANNVARQLGRKEYRLVNLDINTGGQPVRPMMERAFSAATGGKAVAPHIEPGTQTLSVSATGTIELVVK